MRCLWLWRKVSSISWSDKVCNEEVLRRVGEERAVICVINRSQRVWLGHSLRHDDLPGMILSATGNAGMKEGSPYVAVKRRALDREL